MTKTTPSTTKLTMVSVNGKAVFMPLPVGQDGRVRVSYKTLARKPFGINRGDCICMN